MKTFDGFVADASPTSPLLPLIHMTDGYCMRLILGEEALTPQECPTMGHPALYFSYGRPSFRPNGKALPTALSSYAPVCFVMDATAVPVKKSYPFDSGAFAQKMFASSTHKKMELKHFELAANLERPQQIVTTFFGSNTKYFDNDPIRNVTHSPLQFEVESFLALLGDKQSESYDDRISAVEVISDTTILLKGAVKAMVFPGQFLDDDIFKKALSALGCHPIPYSLGARFTNEASFSRISDSVRDYLVKQKILGP